MTECPGRKRISKFRQYPYKPVVGIHVPQVIVHPADRHPAKTAGKGNAGSEETTEPHILSLLKKFPAYPSLYIDTHGGTYAPDTAAAIRGKAVLYRNPFYNELKKKS